MRIIERLTMLIYRILYSVPSNCDRKHFNGTLEKILCHTPNRSIALNNLYKMVLEQSKK